MRTGSGMKTRTFLTALALASSPPFLFLASFAHAETSIVREAPRPIDEKIDEKIDEAKTTPSDVWEARPFAINGHVQTVGPLGMFGLSGEYSFNRYVSGSLGFGSNGAWQGGAMARLRWPLEDHFGVGLGVGGSYGRPFTLRLCMFGRADCPDELKPATMNGDGELFVEGRTSNGFAGRVYGGIHQQLDHEKATSGYVGLGFGLTF